MKLFKNLSKTEKILLSAIQITILALVLNVALNNSGVARLYADEGSSSSEASTSSSSSEESTSDDEESTDSTESTDEASTPSVDSTDEASTPSVDSTDEVSTPSVDSTDEVSTPSVDSTDEPSTASTTSEESVKSGANIEDIVNVVTVDGDTAIVFEDEKFLFLIPVKIQKKLILDGNGIVLSVEQSLWSRLLSLLSF